MIIYTCPKCGVDLRHERIATAPPIHRTYCPKCGWEQSKMEEVVRVPIKEDKAQ